MDWNGGIGGTSFAERNYIFPVFLELLHVTIFVLEYFALRTDNCLSGEESLKLHKLSELSRALNWLGRKVSLESSKKTLSVC